jgi:5,10-methylene-tetrahydrofolate dehydrogenase/methenyl tetrahydrofolate cyclohydrolase
MIKHGNSSHLPRQKYQSATGEAHLITPEWVSEGTVVIDVGISQIPDASTRSGFRIVGDVSPEVCVSTFPSKLVLIRGKKKKKKASRMASHYTPVPGGVGPMTVAMLLYNTFQLTKYQLIGK